MGRRCLSRPVWIWKVSLVLPVMLVTALTAYLGLAVTAPTVHACSCVGSPLSEYADEVDVAFSGIQVSRVVPPPNADGTVSSGDPVTLVFEVTRVFKGSVGSRIDVRTNRGEVSCGVDMAMRGLVGVVAFGGQGGLGVELCSSPVAISELEEVFGEGHPPDPLLGEMVALDSEMVRIGEEVAGLESEVADLREEFSSLQDSWQNAYRLLVTALVIVGFVVVLRKWRRLWRE